MESAQELTSDLLCKSGSTLDQKLSRVYLSLIMAFAPKQYKKDDEKVRFAEPIVRSIEVFKIQNDCFLNSRDITEKYIRDTGYSVNGRRLTDEEKEIIIDFMKSNRMPFIDKVYNAVRDKYLRGELKTEPKAITK